MTKDEFYKTLRSKYVKKNKYIKEDYMKTEKDFIVYSFAMQDTLPYNLFTIFKDGKLERYLISPH